MAFPPLKRVDVPILEGIYVEIKDVEQNVEDALTSVQSSVRLLASVATEASLPAIGNNVDDVRLVRDIATFFYWDGASWLSIKHNLSNPLQFRGNISVAADFPTLATVETGWVFFVIANVTDNDFTKTNTGQSFLTGDEIAWNGTNWTELGPAGTTPLGPAGGDLSGTYPNPDVVDDSHSHSNITLSGVPGPGVDTTALHVTTATLTTNDGSANTIVTIPVADNTVLGISVHAVGRRTDSIDRIVALRRAAVSRDGGGPANKQGSTNSAFTRRSVGAYNVLINVSLNNLLIQVKGKAGHTIDWEVTYFTWDTT